MDFTAGKWTKEHKLALFTCTTRLTGRVRGQCGSTQEGGTVDNKVK